MNRVVLKLGTRRSLLAWAQSGWVAREVERLNPGIRVEMVGIDTRGDKILDVSLQSVEGKEFFVAELDEALRSGAVDFTVHSLKDLSLDRSKDFICIANPRRENPRDVVLVGPGGLQALREGRALRIGTSSPRRMENIPAFLKRALPRWSGGAPGISLVDIRGNVNTRLGRVHEPRGSERYLDGVVLAFAGLIRLFADEKGRVELAKLLEGVRWMVLPLAENPTNPGQGSLAVECRAADIEARETLAKLHDPETGRHVRRERALLAEWGGGCHQKFGATSVHHPELGDILYVRGRLPNDTFVEEMRWDGAGSRPGGTVRPWDGTLVKSAHAELGPPAGVPLKGKAVFLAHHRAALETMIPELAQARVWVSGSSSWFKLAERGVWVEGSAEGLGFASLATGLAESVLGLPEFKDWHVFTHESATGEWEVRVGHVHATYRLEPMRLDPAHASSLKSATHVFWSSGSQYDALKQWVSPKAQHACGPGKTAHHLRAGGAQPVVFPTIKEWKRWLGT